MIPNEQSVLALICSETEWKVVLRRLSPARLRTSPVGGYFDASVGGSPAVRVRFLHTGCGKVPAAAATRYAMDLWRPRLILNLGTCGGFGGHVDPGEVLLASETVIYDIKERTGANDAALARFRTPIDLSSLRQPYPLDARAAVIATADQDLSPESIPRLVQAFKAHAADWESGAIAWVVAEQRRRARRLVILRGVSDLVTPGGRASGEKEINAGAKRVMNRFIDHLREILLWLRPSL